MKRRCLLMLALLSPAKKLDMERRNPALAHSRPLFHAESMELVEVARRLSRMELRRMMKISDNLADLTWRRFRRFRPDPAFEDGCQAALAFAGDVYRALEASSLDKDDWRFANDHLRILSGLYGLLRPLDLIQPYRLEMGRKIRTARGHSLYEFWGAHIAKAIDEELEGHEHAVALNLASNEYVKAANRKALKARLIDIDFKEDRGGQLKTIGVYAKRARGLMARYIIDNRLRRPDELRSFNLEGYAYAAELSSETRLTFVRSSRP
jgi:cytoplasmic iron level regulating protein YaaA (DUF328/UPF0246 family)